MNYAYSVALIPYSIAQRGRKVKHLKGYKMLYNKGHMSDFDEEKMNNHLYREEIIKAQKETYGSAIRYSDTLKTNFLYIANRFKVDDKVLFLRLSSSMDGLMHNFYDLWIKITLIFRLEILS